LTFCSSIREAVLLFIRCLATASRLLNLFETMRSQRISQICDTSLDRYGLRTLPLRLQNHLRHFTYGSLAPLCLTDIGHDFPNRQQPVGRRLAALGWWMWTRRVEAALAGPVLGVSLGVGDFLGAQVKWLLARLRPCQVLSGVHQIAGCGGMFSFPSNHALNTAAAAAFLQVLYPKTGWVSRPLVAVIGYSRVYVGAHYPTDVLGGWAIGGALGAGVALLLLHWPKFRAPHP